MKAKEDKNITVNFIDIGRLFFSLSINPSCKIRDVKEMLKDRVDDYDPSKLSIKLGDLYIDENKSIGYFEDLRNELDMIGYNFRIEIIDYTTNSASDEFKFQFSDSDQRYFNFCLDDKISSIKHFLSRNHLPNCQDESSIALFYKSKIELEDNIAIRSIGIPKNEPIIVKSISYEYSIILPDGLTLIFIMKKRDRVLDLKKKITQIYTEKQLKIADLNLEVNGKLLQNDSDLFYERIRKDQLILVVMKQSKNISHDSLSPEPRQSTNKTSLKRKNSIHFAKQNGTNEQFETFKYIRQNCGDKTYSYKDVKSKIIADVSVYGYITFYFNSSFISVELPYHCSVCDAKVVLAETYFKSFNSHIKASMVKILSIFKENKELADDEFLQMKSTSMNPFYSILLDISFNFKIKNLKIKHSFNFYPNFTQVFDIIKEELLKINPRYTKFRLFYQNKKLGINLPFKVPPNGLINVDIIEKMSEFITVYFEIPNKQTFYLEFDEATSISDVCETIMKANQIKANINLIFAGKILEKDSILYDINLSLVTKENPIIVYIQRPLKNIIRMLSK